jgi:hypothetical protein
MTIGALPRAGAGDPNVTPPDISLRKKPPGWIIQVQKTPDALVLFWRGHATLLARFSNWWSRLFIPIWLCFWIVGWFAVFHRIAAGHGSGFLWIWLLGWTLGGLWVAAIGAAHFRPSIPEAVALGDGWFGYEPGWAPDSRLLWGREGLIKAISHLTAPTRSVVLVKEDIQPFQLERIGERQRLSFLNGLEQVEVGAPLQDREREWLYLILEQWRKGAAPDAALVDVDAQSEQVANSLADKIQEMRRHTAQTVTKRSSLLTS